MHSRTPAAHSVHTFRHVAWLAESGALPTSFDAESSSASPRSVPNSSSSVNLWKKAASACSCDHDGSDSTFSGSGARAGMALLTTASYCDKASLQEGQTARCSFSRFRSSAVSSAEGERAESSMNSSWGDSGNAPAPSLRVTFYHIRYGLAICPEISASAASPGLDSSDCGCFQGTDSVFRRCRRRHNLRKSRALKYCAGPGSRCPVVRRWSLYRPGWSRVLLLPFRRGRRPDPQPRPDQGGCRSDASGDSADDRSRADKSFGQSK